MKKSDLKDTMVVKIDWSEELYVKINNLLFNLTGFLTLDRYNEDLTHITHPQLNIIEVYEIKENVTLENLGELLRPTDDDNKLNKIWERGN